MSEYKTTQCPKCQAKSGDDWSQCGGSCPMPNSPFHNRTVGASMVLGLPYGPDSSKIKLTYDDLRFFATKSQLVMMAEQLKVDLSEIDLKSRKAKKQIADRLWQNLAKDGK